MMRVWQVWAMLCRQYDFAEPADGPEYRRVHLACHAAALTLEWQSQLETP